MRHDAMIFTGARFFTLALCACLAARPAAADTIVTFTTNLGAFDVQLFDTQVPTTVANFLSYVNAGSYTNSIIHRSTTYNPTDIQIVQGGGYTLVTTPTTASLDQIAAAAPIPLEAGLSNLRGTIAMARTDDPNSATSGWFFNVQDNLALDPNPLLGIDGYAVFGEVISSGMDVIDAIAGLRVYNGNPPIIGQETGPFGELPLVNGNTLVMVNSIVAVPEPTTMALAVACVLVYTIRSLRTRRFSIDQDNDGSLPQRTQIWLLGGSA